MKGNNNNSKNQEPLVTKTWKSQTPCHTLQWPHSPRLLPSYSLHLAKASPLPVQHTTLTLAASTWLITLIPSHIHLTSGTSLLCNHHSSTQTSGSSIMKPLVPFDCHCSYIKHLAPSYQIITIIHQTSGAILLNHHHHTQTSGTILSIVSVLTSNM